MSDINELIREGIADAVRRQVKEDTDAVFAGRMAAKLSIALQRIEELEEQARRANDEILRSKDKWN